MRTLTAIVLILFCICSNAFGADKPNIVILLADDLGYRDVSYHGGAIRTPNIDGIAAEGVKLERFYACPMCSPTRSGLMTGRWPIRTGTMRAVIPPWCNYGLPTSEKTIANLVADAGYKHRACIGKWHLGHNQVKWQPLSRGFTHFYGHYNGAIDYFTHEREGEVDWHRGTETIHEEGYTTDLVSAEAVRFIAGVPKGEPYLLYLPFNAPHSPYQAKPEDEAKYPNLEGKHRTYAAMVDCLDQAVGRVLAAIENRGDADNTFVLFMSDNGGVHDVGDNLPYRGSKLTPYEGGVRVVACVRWPGGGLTGGKTCDEHIGYIDIYPTVKRIVGLADAPDPNPLDGVDVLDVMRGKTAAPKRAWYSWEAQTVLRENLALHDGAWKLVVPGASVLRDRGAAKAELYQINDDPSEKHDVAKQHADVVERLLDKAITFRKLRRSDGVPAYGEGREGFKAPKDWVITD
ncbi:MAG: sulfatase-like hydrolase/transferase [Phycisphaera sp.]|nr:sulfatase-like hydrolase/transferase [Phycisphaera sp.]